MTDPAVTPEPAPTTSSYQDDDLVYVDPDLRTVVGRVEFLPNGKSKPLAMKNKTEEVESEEDPKAKGRPVRKMRQRYYPWGTYRTMKKIYKIEGKQPQEDNRKTLDEVIERAVKEPFWD